MPSTYQCVDCQQITTVEKTVEKETGKDSYFEWLMSRPGSKRGVVLKARPA
jgi:hypothetical protein